MSDVKWIKITTDMFDNRKIKHLRRLPDGNNIVLIWVMLLTMAGRCNSGGMIFLTENIPYTPKMLADELDFEESTVRLALDALEQLNMIRTDGFLSISGWEKYQNIEGMDKIREQTRQRVARFRERQKDNLLEGVTQVTENVTLCNATDIEEDIEIEKEKNKKESKKSLESVLDEFAIYDSVKDALRDFIKMRKTIKSPMSERALCLLINKLREMSSDEKTQVAILNQSIMNSWKSVYPLNNDNRKVGANGIRITDDRDDILDGIL